MSEFVLGYILGQVFLVIFIFFMFYMGIIQISREE